MSKLIVLPGNYNSSFFKNEIKYIKKYFDDTIIINYNTDKKQLSSFAKKRGVKYYMVDNNIIKYLFKFDFLKWLWSEEVKEEIKENINLDINSIYKLFYILFYGIFYIKAKKIIDSEIKRNKSEDIYIYSFWLSRPAYVAANYSDVHNIKKIFSRAHGYDLYTDRNPYNYLPFRKFIDSNLDEIHFISKDGLNYFKKTFSNENSKKMISRLGTYNTNNLTKVIKEKEYICIASCSHFKKIKRLDLIIDVIANINHKVKWVHVGNGKSMEEIKDYASQKLDKSQFEFLGRIDNSKILKTYNKYDVDYFINMSDSEGIPVSIMEAISMGIPVIARDVGGVSEIVNNNYGLLIKDLYNMDNVYESIKKFTNERLNNIEKYKKKSNLSKLVWNDKYNADKNYKKFYEKLIE